MFATPLRAAALFAFALAAPLRAADSAGNSAPGGAGASLECETSRPDNSWFVLGEKVEISLAAEGLPPGARLPLSVGVFDEEDNELARIGAEIVADADGRWRGSFAMPADRYGFYRVRPVAEGPDGPLAPPQRGSRPAGCATYAVLPDFGALPQPDEDDAFLGLHGGSWQMAEAMGAHRLLGYGSAAESDEQYETWRRGEDETGRRPWARYGMLLPSEITNRRNFGLFTEEGLRWMEEGLKDMPPGPDGRPRRMMTQFELCASEEGRRHYGDALRALARRALARDYGFRHRFYEVFWEPDLVAPSHEAIVQAARTVWEAVHAEDPDAICAMPTSWNLAPQTIPYLRSLLELGIGKYMDAFSVHPYAYPPEKTGLRETARAVKAMLRDFTGRDVPMIATESGEVVHATREEECAARDGFVRAALILLGEGFRFHLPFYGSDFGEDGKSSAAGDYGLNYNLELPRTKFGPKATSPRPMFPALAAFALHVDGMRPTACLETLGGSALGYAYQGRGGKCTIAVWDAGENPGVAAIPVGRERIGVADVMGNVRETAAPGGTLSLRLSASPKYILDPDPALWGKRGAAVRLLAAEAERRRAAEDALRPVRASNIRAALVDGRPGIAVDLENRSGSAVAASLAVRSGDAPGASASAEVALPAGGRTSMRLPLDGFHPDPFRKYSLVAEVAPKAADGAATDAPAPATPTPGPDLASASVNFFFVKPVPDDAALDSWPALDLAPLPDKPVRNAARHGGPADCSAALGAGWNKRGLLLEVVVDDDVFVQDDEGFLTWRGDCVQLGLAKDVAGGGGNGWADLLRNAHSEIDLALTSGGPEAYRTVTFDGRRFPSDANGGGRIAPAEMPFDVTLQARSGGGVRLRYRALAPWAFFDRTGAQAGEAVWIAAQANDRDAPEEDYASQIVPLSAFDLKTAAPANFGALTLVGE